MTQRLDPVVVAHYRDVLIDHADDLALRMCAICHVSRCRVWRDAYDRLAAGGELMATPERWQRTADLDRATRKGNP